MPKKYAINLPEDFSTIAKAVFCALEGNLYAVGDEFIFTDESGDLEEPRCTMGTLREFEQWLLNTAAAWIVDAVEEEDAMLGALEEHLRLCT